MNIQVLHPNPAQTAPERLRSVPEVPEETARAVTGPDEAPGITAAEAAAQPGEGGLRGELRDRYAPKEREDSAGLYRMTKDEEGNPVLRFDDPQAAQKKETAQEKEAEAEAEEKKAREKEAKTATINTDRVDREIERLKEQIEELERQLNYGGSLVDTEKTEQELTLAKIALRLKDNDTYRRAHAQITTT
ncbi:MAG: hypothetical protein HFF11_10665 [Angelakisella sp.]|jgi:hypothetical protein|nr:hypothetical protein [Angelakisella sp.]